MENATDTGRRKEFTGMMLKVPEHSFADFPLSQSLVATDTITFTSGPPNLGFRGLRI